jgi:hypothetical protein
MRLDMLAILFAGDGHALGLIWPSHTWNMGSQARPTNLNSSGRGPWRGLSQRRWFGVLSVEDLRHLVDRLPPHPPTHPSTSVVI